jgi:carbonic anhydrase/acetyltransferase-like protein (isoleucine patch superfamily)
MLLDRLRAEDSAAVVVEPNDEIWSVAAAKVNAYLADGASYVLLARLGAYLEADVEDLFNFHQLHRSSICRVHDDEGPLDYWTVSTRLPDDSDSLERRMRHARPYFVSEYVNRLKDAADFRRLAVDMLHRRCESRPGGREIRNGVWVDERAKIHPKARVVAPAYIGNRTKLQAGTLVTRASTLERDCEVGGGTIVEDACILPNTYVGRWLEVSHAVVDRSTYVDLQREVAVEIGDEALVGQAGPQAAYLPDENNLMKRLQSRIKTVLQA